MARVERIDLSIPAQRAELRSRSESATVEQIFVASITAGAEFYLHEGAEDAQLMQAAMGVEYDDCNPWTQGFYYTVPAGQAGEVVLWIYSFAGGTVSRG